MVQSDLALEIRVYLVGQVEDELCKDQVHFSFNFIVQELLFQHPETRKIQNEHVLAER